MSTVLTEPYSHSEEKQRSYDNLHQSRETSRQQSSYSSEQTRQTLINLCLERCANRAPYPWQLDAAEAFILGLDCTVLAGTGSGKTLPFLMPAMLRHNGILIVLSPLNSLEEDQVARCQKMGLTAVAFNHKTIPPRDIALSHSLPVALNRLRMQHSQTRIARRRDWHPQHGRSYFQEIAVVCANVREWKEAPC